jgi:hypothetical protein
MVDSNKSVVELLEELRKERAKLDSLIQALEERSGGASPQQRSGSDDEEERKPIPTVTSMPMGFFHNLSQAAAAEKLLRMNPGQALRTGEILEAFKNSGMDVNSKNAPTILYTALKRSPKFERIGSKAWGLREWYPERKKKISNKEPESSHDGSSE